MKEHLKELIAHTNRFSEFYKNKWKDFLIENFETIPIVFKDDMIGSENEVICHDYFLKIFKGDILTERTSGSTGKCLEISWDREDYKKSMMLLHVLRRKYYNVMPDDKLCYFYTNRGTQDPDEFFYEYKRSGLGFSKTGMTDSRLDEIISMINEFEPVWFILQPSIGTIMAKYICENGLSLPNSIRYIEFTGEFLKDSDRKFIQNIFQCDVIADQYGTYEVNSIAYECPAGHLHIMDNVITEITDDSGRILEDMNEGNIIVTSLQNRVMPFIRYNTGDRGYKYKVECSYSHNDCIHIINARSNDLILTEDGSTVSVYEFSRIFMIMEEMDLTIYQYKIIQTNYCSFEVYIVTKADPDMIETVFFNSLSGRYLKECEFKFIFCERLLPDDKTGKIKWFTSCIRS